MLKVEKNYMIFYVFIKKYISNTAPYCKYHKLRPGKKCLGSGHRAGGF